MNEVEVDDEVDVDDEVKDEMGYGMKIMIAGELPLLRTDEFSCWNFGVDVMFLSGIFEMLCFSRADIKVSFLAVAWPNPPKFHLYARESVTDRRVSSTCNHRGSDGRTRH